MSGSFRPRRAEVQFRQSFGHLRDINHEVRNEHPCCRYRQVDRSHQE